MSTAKPPRKPGLSPEEPLRLATFRVQGRMFAVDIMRIREIVRPLRITSVPQAPTHMVGVFNLRGTVLPLFRMTTDDSRFGAHNLGRYLILSVDGRHVALIVDDVLDVLQIRRKDVRLSEAVLSGNAADLFVGVVTVEDEVVFLVNVRALLQGADAVDWTQFAAEAMSAPEGEP